MTIKTILAGSAAAAALALTGGIAYATTSGGPANPVPAVTSTVTTTPATQPAGQNPAPQPAAPQPAATYPRYGGDCCHYGYGYGNGNGNGYQGSGTWCCGNGCHH